VDPKNTNTITVTPEQLAATVALVRQYEADHPEIGRRGQTRLKESSATPTNIRGHGYNGLFAHPGLERRIVNAMVMPRMGLIDQLPSRTSEVDQPIFGIMTGVTAGSGANRATPCAVGPKPGKMKLCMRMLPFGFISLDTDTVDIRQLGRRRDRSEFDDFEFIGNPLDGISDIPSLPGTATGNNPLNDEIGKIMFEFAVEWKRRYCSLVWTGNVANNNAGGGYKEFYGLEYQVNDGYQDIGGTNCPAAASLVAKSKSVGLDPLDIGLVMPYNAFWEISEYWACAYYVARCQTFSTSKVETIDARSVVDLRDQQREGEWLLINGRKRKIIIDDCMTETALAGGSYKSSIYFLPLRYLSRYPGVFVEYLDQDRPKGPMYGAKIIGETNKYYTTNSGRYLWHWRPSNNGCFDGFAEAEMRVVLDVPFLAARLDNVKYTPRIHTQGWDPDYSFYLNGGITNRYDPSFYPPIEA
jgi:hypothetical protein